MPAVAEEFEMEDMLRAFENVRRNMVKMVTEMTPEQVNFNPDAETYSLSEVFTHIVSAQGNVYNGFLDTGESTRPHIDPIPRGAGAGAEKGKLPTQIGQELQEATDQLIMIVRETYDPANKRTIPSPLRGESLTQKAMMLFQLLHDLDHFRQSQMLRRSRGFPSRVRRTETLPAAESTESKTTQEIPRETDKGAAS
jgi:hypothetical protein